MTIGELRRMIEPLTDEAEVMVNYNNQEKPYLSHIEGCGLEVHNGSVTLILYKDFP